MRSSGTRVALELLSVQSMMQISFESLMDSRLQLQKWRRPRLVRYAPLHLGERLRHLCPLLSVLIVLRPSVNFFGEDSECSGNEK